MAECNMATVTASNTRSSSPPAKGLESADKRDVIIIRPWCPHDKHGVWNVLRDGSFSNVPISFLLVLKRRTTTAAVFVLGSFVLGYSGCVVTALVTVAVILCSIYCALWLIAMLYLYGPPLRDMKSVQKSYFSDEDSRFWVAELEGRIVGTIAVVRQERGNCGHQKSIRNAASKTNEKVAWLRRMAVLRECRGHGVARALVEMAVRFCVSRDYDKIELITTEVHQAARRLYEKSGFRCTAFRPHKYCKGLVRIWTYEYELQLR